jgi:hypothetical protein
MRFLRSSIWLLSAALCASAAAQSSAPISINQYRARLTALEHAVEQPHPDFLRLRTELPEHFDVDADNLHYEIDNRHIRGELKEAGDAKDDDERDEAVDDLKSDLQSRISQADAFEHPLDSTVQPKLQAILKQKQFRYVSGQDPRNAFYDAILRGIAYLFRGIARNPEQALFFAKAFIYGVILVALGLAGFALFRWASGQAGFYEPQREYMTFAPSAKGWQQWLEEARAAAARGDLREAVHLTYWAAISRLESAGAWRPDRARTPREYLRLLTDKDPSHPVLVELTRRFELAWYGQRQPNDDDYGAVCEAVEQLGCR